MSAGVTTEFDEHISDSVQPKYKATNTTNKNATSCKPETSYMKTTSQEKENTCPKCNKMYLQKEICNNISNPENVP